jgi:hypothetical protein
LRLAQGRKLGKAAGQEGAQEAAVLATGATAEVFGLAELFMLR